LDDEGSDQRFREGTVIAGKYQLTHTLGRGGMGLVVAATHLQLERRVAIKFLLPEHLEKVDVVSRFTREARAAAKIQSDHVAHVLDVGVDGDSPYMVMEYLEGEDLKDVLARRGPLGVEEATKYIRQACEALAEAHELGIVHRDLKPANLFLAIRPNGRSLLKVLDFGISKIMNPATETELTLTSRAIGSPSYMSPEQLTASRSLDARADVWGLGVVLYELLTRRRPFRGDAMPQVVAMILKGEFEKLDWVRPELPAELVAAVHKCLEISPDQRFASVTELALALAPFAPLESTSAVDGIPRAKMPSHSSIPRAAPGEDSNTAGISSVVTPAVKSARPPRRAMLAVAGGVGMLTMLGLGALVLTRGQATSAPVAATPAAPPPRESASVATSPAPVAPALPPTEPAPSASPSAAPAVASAVAATPPPRHPAAAPPARGGATPRAGAPPARAAAPTSSPASPPACHLVTYLDEHGDKHFKQECP
jgi:serine/threonine-protein kinase